ncbi:hypothetical protein M573_110066 [Prevotella intermedia ZT]|uniref:KAP NTPase domain-containing protein n=1 Tax=Prevotella intermedia ZT TaxID=1347790 RepID=A0AAP0V3W6_PREIN|nr:P-loop NTPase fold protein [Prevotella intermedia]KJJ87145.1 hypothetical protein M573_110066 [Prevotella intermedia ZT]
MISLNKIKMCKIKQYIKPSKIIAWANEHNIIRFLIICLITIYFLVAYNSPFMDWYNDNVIPIIAYFIPNFWSILITFFLIIIAFFDIIKKYRMRYRYDKKIILALIFIVKVLISCRLSGNYNYVSFIWKLCYVDAISLICVSYSIAGIFNKGRFYYNLNKNKNIESSNSDKNILKDWPIKHKKDDIFNFYGEAKKLSDEIKTLDRNKTWSLAITAPWGTGKTSFLNLILENISEKDFEIVHFIPRDSKSFKTIQEDFFSNIACVLSKYDYRCSSTMKDYMASLQLIDNQGVIEKLVSVYRIWDKDSIKDSIKQSFTSLNKKVLVIIDDFDRLSKDEILEVLKLIDCNAAFTNLVFLTAYDKEQVNKALGDSFRTKDACFVDKFFNLEYSIPPRPYSYISIYIEDKLYKLLNTSNDEKKEIQQTLTKRRSIFEEHIPTLRDAKRYINQFMLDFEQVRGDVIIEEFLLVQIIKYRDRELYKKIYRKKYIKSGDIINGNTDLLYLRKDSDEVSKILPILNILFPEENSSVGTSYLHIYNNKSFDNYFVNQIYSSLRIRDMQEVFTLEWEEAIKKMDDWITNDEKIKDFIGYVDSRDMDNFTDGTQYIRYAEIITYLVCKLPNSRAYWLFLGIIRMDNMEGYDKKYKLNFDSYKDKLLNIIKSNDTGLTFITDLHVRYKTFELHEKEYLIEDEKIWSYIKEKFIETTKNPQIDTTKDTRWLLESLYKCIDHMEETTRLIHLDSSCLKAYRKRIENEPNLYISNFVFLGGISSNNEFNSIACEPFWNQIFDGEQQFEAYLQECCEKEIEKSTLAWNFWQLYKANDFKQIEFNNQGDVQEKINNNLEEEVKKLKKMKDIKREVLKIPEEVTPIHAEEIERYKKSLLQYKKELEELQLYISLNGKISKAINTRLENYAQNSIEENSE